MPNTSTEPKRLALILRAQLPYTRERNWLFPVLTEGYLPLLKMLGRLADDDVSCCITLAFPETLRAMLDDPSLRHRYVAWLEEEIATAEDECARQVNIPPLLVLAQKTHDRLVDALKTFTHDWRCDIPQQWRRLAASGHIELAATGASGALLSDLELQPGFLRAQIRLGLESSPSASGFLPAEGVLSRAAAREISAAGISWVAAECQHQKPFTTPEGLVVLPTDSKLRWLLEDAKLGFPAAPVYRSFHTRLPLKYYAGGVDREYPTVIYENSRARPVVEQHANAFLDEASDGSTIVLEMETLGHWWVEGISFLEQILRNEKDAKFVTPEDLIADISVLPQHRLAEPASLFPPNPNGLASATESILDSISKLSNSGSIPDESLRARALRQALRECLITQSNDWRILRDADPDGLGKIAHEEVESRLTRARELVESVRTNTASEVFVTACESDGSVFPNLDWRSLLSRL